MSESGTSQKMPGVDQGKLSNIQKMYIKRVERFNKGRASEYTTKTTGARRVGLIFCGSVLGIYGYWSRIVIDYGDTNVCLVICYPYHPRPRPVTLAPNVWILDPPFSFGNASKS